MPKKGQKPPLHPVTARLTPDMFEQLEGFQASLNLDNRSDAVRILITMGLSYFNQLDEFKQDLKVLKEENRQLAALLFANLPHDKDFDPKSIPEIIRQTVEHANELVNRESEE